MPPDYAIEDECCAEVTGARPEHVCGIDEAGRGPWAGPVVAAAVILDRSAIPDGIDDSKQLNAEARASLFDAIIASCRVGVGIGSVEEIERLNILHANDLAMARALEALDGSPSVALIDGKWKPRTISIPVRTVVGGDALSLSIAAASIVAKVTRDRIMHRLHEECPGYGWNTNVGYGTPQHRNALRRLGVTVHHRRTWAPVLNVLKDSAGDAVSEESFVTA